MDTLLRRAEDSDSELIKNIFNMYQNELGAYAGEFSRLNTRGYFDEKACSGDTQSSNIPMAQ